MSIIIFQVYNLGGLGLTSINIKLVFVSLGILLVLLFASACGREPAQIAETAEPSATSIPTDTPTNTPPPPTPTNTEPPPTATRTPTPTSTLTTTPTSQPPAIVVDQNVICRTGPGLIYDIRAYLAQGAEPMLLGQTEDNTWLMVEEPEFKAACWVSSEYVILEGDADLLPIFTPEPTPTPIPSPTPKLKGMRIFLVNLDTGGPFGCGDGLVYFISGKQRTGNLERDISSALNALFKLKTEFVGGYYNPVHNAHLYVKGVDVIEENGHVYIYLAGSIPKPPDVCEAERIHDQVWETARQISGYRHITIRVGNNLLGDLIAVGDR